MEIAAIRRDKRRTRRTHTDRYRFGGGMHTIPVGRIRHGYGNRIAALDRRILIVHHIEPKQNGNDERTDFHEQIVLHYISQSVHHFFLQPRTSSKIDERAL